MVGENDELELVMSDGFLLMPEARPAIATIREAVRDDDGYVTHYELNELACAVHTVQSGRGGWVCEMEDGTVKVVPYENVRFLDDNRG